MKKLKFILIVTLILIFASCEDPWDKHLDEYSTARATENLLQIIQGTGDLSEFANLITEAGAEALFSSSRISTVWAPNNSALAGLSSEMTGDPDVLLQFIQNHIAYEMHPLNSSEKEIRCKMLNGKRVLLNMAEGTIYGENIISEEYNKVATNGILHITNKYIELRQNIWEYLESAETGNIEIDYLNSLTGTLFVDSLADIMDYDSLSNPIYDTASGTIWYNQYLFENADLRNEDSLFTLLVLENDVFQGQYDRFAPYYRFSDNDTRDSLVFIKYMVSLDLVASGFWRPEDLAGSLKTVNGIEVPFNNAAINESIEASNGIIYHVNSCDLTLEAKFPAIIVEAEDENKVLFPENARGFTRIKPLASGGYDYVLDDHNGNPGRMIYNAGMVAATKYNFYWVAVDDFGGAYYGNEPDSLIQQKLNKLKYLPDRVFEDRYPVHLPISDSLLYVVDLSYTTVEERYAGSFTFGYYQDLWFDLAGSGNNTTLTLDYVKIVPVFE